MRQMQLRQMNHCSRGLAPLAAVMLSFALAGCGSPPPPAPRLTVSGSRFEIGLQVGKHSVEAIEQIHSSMLRTGRILTLSRKATLYARAGELAKHIRPEDIQEMKGVAQGAGMAYEDILYLNMFYHLTTGRLMCRQLAIWGPRTDGGDLIHARNLDWADYPGGPLRSNNLVLNVTPDKGQRYLVLTWPSVVGVLTGTNASGITVAYNRFITPRREKQHVSESVFFTIGRILRTCETLDQAIDMMKKAKPMGDGSVMISDANAKRAVVVEIVNGKMGVRTATDGLIANANHQTAEAGFEAHGDYSADWPAGQVARTCKPGLRPMGVRDIMRNSEVLQWTNLLSVIFVPSRNEMYLACGQYWAADGEFTKYEIFPVVDN